MYRSRSVSRQSSSAQGPIVAFLIIACFGLLFVTGCSSVRGPETSEQQDTFTAEDAERLRDASTAVTASGSVASLASETATESGETMLGSTASGTVATADADLVRTYDALRMGGGTQAGNAYRVVNTFLNVRSTPNVGGAFVTKLNQGDMVTVAEFVNAGWAKISLPEGKEGYVSAQYIAKLVPEEKLKDEQKAFDGIYFVNYGFVNVRTSPDSGSEKMGEIPGQAFVRPLSTDKDWARVAFEGKEGYVSMQFLAPFKPAFLVRQDNYQLSILHYDVSTDGMIAALPQHIAALKAAGAHLITFKDLQNIVLTQEVRDVRLAPKSVILAISGITPENAKQVSDAVTGAGGTATLFLATHTVGLSGISEKLLLTLAANGLDVQSMGHTGDDLRTLTQPQTQLELNQSRKLIEDSAHQSVFAVLYPQGGVNERVMEEARKAGYLFGIGSAPDGSFSRDQFLRLPSYTVNGGMAAADVVKLLK